MRLAALTMVFNERHFLPIWIHHYGAVVGPENLFVVDDGSDDGSTTGLGPVKVMRGKKSLLDEVERAKKISEIQAELLTRYDAVIVSDVDELIVVDPAAGTTLADYIAARVETSVTAMGLNVQFSAHFEAPLRRGMPLFRQRRYAQFDWGYCKTLISRVPVQWRAGFHTSSAPVDIREHLLLFHLRSVDPGISLDRLQSFRKIQRSESAVISNHSEQFSIADQEYLDRFYFTGRKTFENARPAADFDSTIHRLAQHYRDRDFPAMNLEVGHLLIIPSRFSDSIAIPGLDPH